MSLSRDWPDDNLDRNQLTFDITQIGLPYAIREAGFVTGIVLLIGLGVITDWTIRLSVPNQCSIPFPELVSDLPAIPPRIVVNAKLTGQKTYSDIMEACFGYKGRAAVAFIQFAMAFGGMCAFAVILGDTIPRGSISTWMQIFVFTP